MDPFRRSFLFTQMMRALELGDKNTADKIELLIRNFDSNFPVPLSFYIPSVDETSVPDISPSSFFGSDSLEMIRPSKASGSR